MNRFVAALLMAAVLSAPFTASFDLSILHTNDVHARFESFNLKSGSCTQDDISSGKCFGGAARRLTAINQIRMKDQNVLLLDGGDQYQGTLWYTALKWEPIAAYMNAMNYTAMAFGNHEFDDRPEGLAPFLKNVTFPVINSHMEASNSSIVDLFRPFHIVTIGGETVGIVGYTTPETSDLSLPGPMIKFHDPIVGLQKVVDELRSKGVNKIIAVGHAGILFDRNVCTEVAGIDVVVGGHTNTFLYTGKPPSTEEAEGPYPEAYTAKGDVCLVVQDFAFGKYLGYLRLNFDDNGVLKKWTGNPILINTTYGEDSNIVELLKPFKKKLSVVERMFVGTTAVALDGRTITCRLRECNLGNLVADAYVHFYQKNYQTNNSAHWTNVAAAMLNGGSIREFQAEPMTNLTLGDLYTFMPFGNTIELIRIKGKHLKEAFEHSVKDYNTLERHGKFLQVSGFEIVYDLNQPNGRRVRSLAIKCAECPVPTFQPVHAEASYSIVTNSYLKNGGDGYRMIKDNVISSDGNEILDIDAVMEYIVRFLPVFVGEDGRITFVPGGSSRRDECLTGACNYVHSNIILLIFVFLCVFIERVAACCQ